MFAQWLAANRLRRVVLIAGLFVLPVLGLLSSAIVVMAAELKGPREALLDCAGAIAVLIIVAWFSGVQDIAVLVSVAAITWSLWLLLGGVIWKTGSLTLALQALVILAVIALVLFESAIGNPVEYWQPLIGEMYANFQLEGEDTTELSRQLAPLMCGTVVAVVLTSSVITVLLGTSLAERVKPLGFSEQFRQLRLGYVIGGLAAVVGLASLFGLAQGMLLVLGAAFMFHGIAVVAWWAGQRKWPAGWWIGLCILPILLVDFLIVEAALLSALGFVDNWYDLRRAPAPE